MHRRHRRDISPCVACASWLKGSPSFCILSLTLSGSGLKYRLCVSLYFNSNPSILNWFPLSWGPSLLSGFLWCLFFWCQRNGLIRRECAHFILAFVPSPFLGDFDSECLDSHPLGFRISFIQRFLFHKGAERMQYYPVQILHWSVHVWDSLSTLLTSPEQGVTLGF